MFCKDVDHALTLPCLRSSANQLFAAC
jgi:hypothetical protein